MSASESAVNSEVRTAIREHLCENCAENMYTGVCCDAKASCCGAKEFGDMIHDILIHEAPGTIYSQIQDGPYRGSIDPCLCCMKYVDNDKADAPSCPGWSHLGGMTLAEAIDRGY
jgi:hypothetical protein